MTTDINDVPIKIECENPAASLVMGAIQSLEPDTRKDFRFSTAASTTDSISKVIESEDGLLVADLASNETKVFALHSVQAVFATYELIEAILTQSTMKTVLFAQQVNSTFRYVISRSTKLQQKLFFQSVPLSSHPEDKKATEWVLNPLLVRRESFRYLSPRCWSPTHRIILRAESGRIGILEIPLNRNHCRRILEDRIEDIENHYVESSWKRMRLVQVGGIRRHMRIVASFQDVFDDANNSWVRLVTGEVSVGSISVDTTAEQVYMWTRFKRDFPLGV